MSLADVRRRLHRLEERLPPRARALIAGKGRPLLALNRRAVARGAALGVFFGVMIPFGQIPAAVLLSPVFRANALVAAGSTLVTNPLTFPPIWGAAYLLGGWLLAALAGLGITPPSTPAEMLGAVPAWLPKLAAGLLVIATVGALAAYHGVAWSWARWTQRRWRRRDVKSAPRLSDSRAPAA